MAVSLLSFAAEATESVTLGANALAEEYAKSRRVDIQLLSFEYEVTE